MPELHYRELSTILAALRHWQCQVGAETRRTDPIAGKGGQVPLTDTEIDGLCEAVDTMIAVAFPEFSGHPELDPDASEQPEAGPGYNGRLATAHYVALARALALAIAEQRRHHGAYSPSEQEDCLWDLTRHHFANRHQVQRQLDIIEGRLDDQLR